MTDDRTKGVLLALSSSAFIGASFIVKKKGLQRSARHGSTSAGAGGHGYLTDALWWTGMVTMILGEIANFAAYIFAPAILVTPLGALSVIISAILASMLLDEQLHKFGKVGCSLCVVGSTIIVLHAPEDVIVNSLDEIWSNAIDPGFLCFLVLVAAAVSFLAFYVQPRYGSTHVLVPIAICSLMGALSVMSCKAVGIGLKLTIDGTSQLSHPVFWVFLVVLGFCLAVQMHYLNLALFLFNTAVVSPIYYVFFTTATIIASVSMYRDWQGQTPVVIISQLCGFATNIFGVYLLHATHEHVPVMNGSPDRQSQSYSRVNTMDAFGGSEEIEMDSLRK